MSETIIIKAENFINSDYEFSGQVQYSNGTIIAVGQDLGNPDYYFGKEFFIFPGFIDKHVHLRYGQEHKEDPITGTMAAINGGITRVMDMPNNPVDIAPLTRETYDKKVEWGKKGLIPIHHYAATKPGSKPIEGIDHYKAFIGQSVGNLWFETDDQLMETFSEYKGKNVTFHCEYQGLIDNSKKYHHQKRPAIAEKRALRMAEDVCFKYGIRGNIAHASTVDSFYTDLYKEITFHHSLLNKSNSPFGKVNPPIRGNAENLRRNMYKATFIASDHAPHTFEEKMSDNPPSGLPMVDTFGNCAGYLIKHHGVRPGRIAELCSINPAAWIDIGAGKIEPGYEASFTIIDMKNDVKMSELEIYSKAGWTPFNKFEMPEVDSTVVQGKFLKFDGKLMI